MRLLLIGAPGSGKGTQAVRIADRLGITHISSGDLLRQHVKDGTAIGRQVQEYVSQGATFMDDWRRCRVDGAALQKLGAA